MKTHYLLLALTVSAVGIATIDRQLVNLQPTQIAQAAQIAQNDAQQIARQVAAKVTVRIRVGQGIGSGVLLGKKGNTYLVLTNAHVIRAQAGITIETPDGQSYTARRVKDPQVGNFDVAVLEFTSPRVYLNWGVPIYNLLTRLNPDILYGYKQLPKLHRSSCAIWLYGATRSPSAAGDSTDLKLCWERFWRNCR